MVFGVHSHIEVARNWGDAMKYCCKLDFRIGDDYYSDIREEILGTKVSNLVKVKQKIDEGVKVKNLANDFFSTWCV